MTKSKNKKTCCEIKPKDDVFSIIKNTKNNMKPLLTISANGNIMFGGKKYNSPDIAKAFEVLIKQEKTNAN